MTGGFIIEPLSAHDRSAFVCGTDALDRYLREQASQDVKRLMASCFVAVETATNALAGYYTLAATSVMANSLPPELLKRLPRYDLRKRPRADRYDYRHFPHGYSGKAGLMRGNGRSGSRLRCRCCRLSTAEKF